MYMRKVFIYCLKDPVDDNIRYVGKTTNMKKRLRAHINRSRNNKYHSAMWISSLLKNGLEPKIELIEECLNCEWQERERYWIKYYGELFDLTNHLEGGEGCATYGRLGKPWSKQQHINNKKARVGLKINQNDKNGNRKKAIRKYFNSIKKPICQYNLDGDFIEEWESAVDAGKGLNLSHSNITQACKGKKERCGEFMWRYKGDNITLNIGKYIEPIKHNVLSIIQLNKDIEFIDEFKSISEASKVTNIKRTSIINCLKERSKTSGGFIWKYKNK